MHWSIDIAYLVAAILFIRGIKGLTHPRTAVQGNLLSALGMTIAIVATAFVIGLNWWVVIAAMIVGSAIGAVAAVKVPMTGMPQMVAIFNGFGGGASVFVAWGELTQRLHDVGGVSGELAESAGVHAAMFDPQFVIATALAGIIGAVTFSGSMIAYGKLQEFKIFWNPWVLPAHQLINALLALITIGLGVWLCMADTPPMAAYVLLVVVSLVLGVTLTCPIGGADMPVVIALLNSYSGLAAAATGFVISNSVLIITGSLVGASGLILTSIMCVAMNRSLANVIFGKIDASKAGASADEVYEGKIKSTSADEIAMMLDGVQRVVIVPGYGMAVSQAQHAVHDLYNELEERGVNVEFAIHPVAGRMPGHMNVLLAEVDIPYEKLVEMDAINPQFSQVDVAIVLGANDVVNPVAREADSAIAGMPILDVDKARTVIVIKRSLSPGFAGIPNPLFALDNTLMYFGDGKKTVVDLVNAIKEN
ncbi:NAD(P)(+) transhydrogenase (Re/Si-specific) subunit beta [Planctomycetales bacterium ZRK34]|nr:NAD(P)(+) transhydrogenase (Re/Si-specific) subunit beta [Planctomycetales bacterium ZRK34]